MRAALIVTLSLADLLGTAFLTLMLRLVWEYPERSRKGTVITVSVAAAVAAAASVYTVSRIPAPLFGGVPSDHRLLYEFNLINEWIRGTVTEILLLFTPHVILKTKRFFRLLLIQFAAILAAEGLFGLVATALALNADNPAKVLAEAVTNIVVYAALALFFGSGLKKERPLPLRLVIDTLPRWFYFLVMIFALTVYGKSSLFDGGLDNAVALRIYNVLWSVSIVGIIVCAAYFAYKIILLTYQQNQILKQMNAQRDNYEAMLKSDEQLREFRHDYKNHMMVVTALLNSGRSEEAADYLEKVKVSSGVVGRQFSTGSFIADAILNNKNSLAEEYTVHLSFEGRVPERGIENSDLCTVLANLLDNAIDNTKRYDGDRYVRIESNVRSGYLALSLSNPVSEKVPIRNNRVRTTKSDARNHGIGLRNVERTAEKYGGRLLLTCDEKEFCADVSMKLAHDEEKENRT